MAGRDFNAHDTPESPNVAIVNQTMAKKFFAGRESHRQAVSRGGRQQIGPLGRDHRRGEGCEIRIAAGG